MEEKRGEKRNLPLSAATRQEEKKARRGKCFVGKGGRGRDNGPRK